MPLYETIAVAEKHSVVLDIGHSYTKIGFAREAGPRFIIPSVIEHPNTKKITQIWQYTSEEELFVLLKKFIYTLYFKYLVVNPKDRRVVAIESVVCCTAFRETLAKVLFTHFEIPSLLLVPSDLMAIFTLGVSTALVLDVGYNGTTVLPICDNYPILNMFRSSRAGAMKIHRRIEAELMEKAKVKTSHGVEKPLSDICNEPLSERVIEDIKVRTCFVTPRSRGLILQAHEARKIIQGTLSPDSETLEKLPPPPDVDYPLDSENILTIPGNLREWSPELLFEQDVDDQSIATMLLDVLVGCPIDSRKQLANNVIIMGGTSMLPGFKHSFLTEVKMWLDDPRYSKRLPLKEIKIHHPPTKENCIPWLGASIFGATEAVTSRSITKEQYHQNPHIPDWCDQDWCKDCLKSRACS